MNAHLNARLVAAIAGAALTSAALVSEAAAVSRYTSTSFTCADIQAKVRNERKAVLAWRDAGSNLPRYGLYIANRSVCLPGNGTNRAYVPTRDKALCMVKKCVPLDLGVN